MSISEWIRTSADRDEEILCLCFEDTFTVTASASKGDQPKKEQARLCRWIHNSTISESQTHGQWTYASGALLCWIYFGIFWSSKAQTRRIHVKRIFIENTWKIKFSWSRVRDKVRLDEDGWKNSRRCHASTIKDTLIFMYSRKKGLRWKCLVIQFETLDFRLDFRIQNNVIRLESECIFGGWYTKIEIVNLFLPTIEIFWLRASSFNKNFTWWLSSPPLLAAGNWLFLFNFIHKL